MARRSSQVCTPLEAHSVSVAPSLRDWRRLVTLAPNGMAVVDGAGRLVAVNHIALHLLGHPDISRPANLDFGAGWRTRDAPFQSLWTGLEGRTHDTASSSSVVALEGPDGERRWLSIAISPIADASERQFVVTIDDVTAFGAAAAEQKVGRRDAEQALEQAKAFQSVLNSAALIAVIDRRGRFVEANAPFCRLSGFEREELIGRHYLSLQASDTPRTLAWNVLRTLRRRSVWRGELCEISKGGQRYWADTSVTPLHDRLGRIDRFLIVRTDITAGRRAEMLLAEAIDAVPDGFVIFDEDDKLAVCNAAYRNGYPETAPIVAPGISFEEIIRFGLENGQYPAAGTDASSQTAWLKERLASHQAEANEVLQQLPNGRWMQVRERRTKSGHSVGFRTDVTDLVQQRELLKTIIDSFPGGISYIDANLRLRHHNAQFREILELPEDLIDRPVTTLKDIISYNAYRGEYGPGDPEQQIAERLELATRNVPHQFERARPDGRVIAVQGVPVSGGGFVTSYIDVTERKSLYDKALRASQEASEKAQQLSLTLEHMAQGLVMFGADERLSIFNQRYVQLFELDPGQVVKGMSAFELLQLRGDAGTFSGEPVERLIALKRNLADGEEFRTTLKTRSGRLIQSVTSPIPGGGWVTTHEDVTDRAAALERIHHAAHHDALTGLNNRAALKSYVGEALLSDQSFSILMIDLDRFKAVNDTYGHAVGDEILRQVAERMRRCVLDEDIVARLGGDEFAIIHRSLPQVPMATIAMGHRLLEAVSEPYMVEDRQLLVGASIGIAMAPTHGASADELMRNADAALYKAKADGRNGVRVYDSELDAIVRSRRALEADIRLAHLRGEFRLHYQPVVDLRSGEVTGVEALLRWQHPERGLISPAAFVPLLEETGLINPVGDWVIEKACLDAKEMPPHIRVAVNVSPVQLRNRSMCAIVEPLLMATGLDPARLELEVTESILIDRDAVLLDDLQRLRKLGVHIVLDDFGTGYSSLSYIRTFPFDKLKIDKVFIDDLGRSADAHAVVCAVIGLTKSLGISSTAEGIEQSDQAQLLANAGCTFGQGYLFGRPVPADELGFENRRIGEVIEPPRRKVG
ncbi:bifunctional diguanylate cyclase/phosphodiesterase [Phreatobacter oligotrophus]|uniref:PAS domain S-box-containing protein/diguanylate cyclase (GGDEF)-like protein n=1 Tax=Phreatobacter oligotrophus TaxID=1122261 RepID=A0A2T4YS36_9HYPH|nr:PAS-domain containing protein [Phreatobacter oligotrophus]PTM46464.1 PAS domain S-box-containing protein/diguanylate cyclase (GGDEF)-like protein [Phreatobacter oligotrophus]